jgi:uncharacterized membrane protein
MVDVAEADHGMTLASPLALWLLAAVPLVWLAPLFGRTNFNRRQRYFQAGIRSLLLAVLALAIARPLVFTTSERQSIVYAVDVSHSIGSRAIESAAKKIDELNGALRPAHSRIVVFGRTAAAIADTNALRALAGSESAGAIDRQGTDLETAIEAARAELAPGHVPRIVLFTDGRATGGDTAGAVVRSLEGRIPISVEPLAVRSLEDAWIEEFDLPQRLVTGATLPAVVTVGSLRRATGTVELRSGGKVLTTRSVPLGAGSTTVGLDVVLDAPGAANLQAVVSVPDDTLAANNALARSVWIEPRTKVLYVEGAAASSRYLSSALTASGFDVTVRGPSGLPASVAEFDPWDVVILSDVSRGAIREASMTSLSEWVERRGGGLLVAGGESVFGEGGYRNSPIERLTPVTFERKDEPEVALVLVLDRSWSMAGPSIDLCKAAAQAAVDVLTDEQSIGILTFNDAFNWDVTLRTVGGNREAIRKRISAIGPGGHTLIYPAVEQAYKALKPAKARAKHVILLSDGRSYPADYETLIMQMSEARITVSSVAVGPSADPELLSNIAKWGKGRYYAVSDAKELPQIFVKEAKNAATPAFDEQEITPVVKTPAFLTGVDLTRVPRLKGQTSTVLKDTALEVISTDDENPLLAFWPIGLGRTAVFSSDVKDRWAANWIAWRGYAPFFSAVVRALERQRSPAIAIEVTPGPVRGRARSIGVAVEARHPDGRYRDLLRPAVQVSAEGGAAATIALSQVAPGRYEGSVVADASRPHTFTVAGGDPGIKSRQVLPDVAAEYRFRPMDEPLLKSIASATGGSWMPTAAALSSRPDDRRTERRPIWGHLLALALGLWLLDLVLRRIRVFEPSA